MSNPIRRRIRVSIGTGLTVLLVLFAWLPAQAHDTSVKEEAKQVGRSVGSAGRQVGQGAKKAGKTVGKVAKDGVEAAKQGGRDVKKAIVGD